MASSGYGPSTAAPQDKTPHGIPFFDGRVEHFEDFKYKAKAVFLELGLNEITFCTYADANSLREKLKSIAMQSPVKTRASQSEQPQDPRVTQAQIQLADMERKSAQVARLLISRLSHSVSQHLRQTLPDQCHFDGIEIWNFLQVNYGSSKLATSASLNIEKLTIDLLRLQWTKSMPLSSHLRTVKSKLTVITSHKRISNSTTSRSVVTSLITP